MILRQQKIIITLGLFLAVCVALSLVISSSPQTIAQGPGLPTPTTGPTITPVPGATNTPVATTVPTSGPSAPNVETSAQNIAYIQLSVPSSMAGNWSVVQWQDFSGNWHNVEGWRASVPATGPVLWAVEAKDFATGPFRWVVIQGETTIASSTSFNLPNSANQIITITANTN